MIMLWPKMITLGLILRFVDDYVMAKDDHSGADIKVCIISFKCRTSWNLRYLTLVVSMLCPFIYAQNSVYCFPNITSSSTF
jgi:hypothetical protein